MPSKDRAVPPEQGFAYKLAGHPISGMHMRLVLTALLSATVASICTLAGVHLFARDTRPSDPELERRLQALERRSIPAAQAGHDSRPGAGPVAAHPAPSANRRTSVEGQSEQAQTDAVMRDLGNRFRAEQVSAVWAKNTEIAVLEAITSDEAKAAGVALPTDVNVQCKSTLCNITAIYRDDGAAAEAATILAMDISGALPQTQRRTIYRPDGSVELQVYAMKK